MRRMTRGLPRSIAAGAIVLAIGGCRPVPRGAVGARETGTQASLQVDSASIAVGNGTRLFYEIAGAGSVVVLMHGGNLDGRMWDDQFSILAQSHRVLRFDERGFGRSGPADTPYEAQADLYALLTALHIPRASFVGLSLGGRVAIDFALTHPDMVDKLVLASPGLGGWQWAAQDSTWQPKARPILARGDTTAAVLMWLQSDYMRPLPWSTPISLLAFANLQPRTSNTGRGCCGTVIRSEGFLRRRQLDSEGSIHQRCSSSAIATILIFSRLSIRSARNYLTRARSRSTVPVIWSIWNNRINSPNSFASSWRLGECCGANW